MLSDSELMYQAKRGKLGAFAELVSRHQQPLFNLFRRLGASVEDAEELVQETFLRLFRSRKRYRRTAKFATFLYKLALNSRADWLRRLRRKDRLPESWLDTSPFSEWTGEMDDRLDIEHALQRLSPKLREVVLLNIFHGFRYAEIAELLGVPLGTVKSRMSTALRQLRELLNVRVR